MAVDPLIQVLLAGFVTEAQELCEKLTRDLLDLERPGDREHANKLYDGAARGLHTLKGTAATVGLEPLAHLAHRMEDVLLPHKKGLQALPGTVTDALLRALDAFLLQVRQAAEGKSVDEGALAEPHALLDQLAASQPGIDPAPPPAPEPVPAPVVETPAEQAEPVEAAQDGDGSWRVRVRDVFQLMREVERLRELRLRLEQRRREIELALEPLVPLEGAAETRHQLLALCRQLASDAEEAGDIVDAAEEGLKAIGTVPVRLAFEPLRRAVRDLCRQLGKEAKVSLVGGDLALDRRVLEALRGPLLHLVRNAVDHGIERPQERETRGKHREGVITVRMEQQGNMLFATVEDDGGGIDPERVRDVALAKGLVPAERLALMGAQQLHQLLFLAGFSTTSEVTNSSGRGVGLDVVKSEVEALDGHVEVQSTRGQGTRFVLTLPVEFGSSPLLALRAGEHRFGLPLPAVESLTAARQEELRISRNKVQLSYRDQLVPVFSLGALLGFSQPAVPADETPLLIVQAQGRRMALAVDEVVGDRDLVIRPLPAELRDVPAYQGAATLAGGELLLVLRADWVVDHVGRQAPSVETSRRALVVDDSLTARALHRTMLESGGFTVHTASSGQQALEQLVHAPYDIIVCDIGMAGMDGYEFTEAVRRKGEWKSLPVVLVSAHDSAEDRQRGLASGADGFVSKKECVSGRLLSEVSAVMSRRRTMS